MSWPVYLGCWGIDRPCSIRLGVPSYTGNRPSDGGSFPADTSAQSELTVNSTSALLSAENISSLVYPDRSKRPGTEDPPYAEILRRQTDYFTRRRLEVALATPRFRQLKSDSYLVFRKFYPSVILNYNLDGLASDLCTPPHEVIAAHGTVDRGYGSPEMEEFLRSARVRSARSTRRQCALRSRERRSLRWSTSAQAIESYGGVPAFHCSNRL